MARYIVIHGHFYQPPRENPWLEMVPRQISAAPHHDWNERITRECYARNAAARLLGRDGRVARLINNYAYISYDFGPTLLRWLEREEPAVYEAVLESDRKSRERFAGHGSAMAQSYHHAILPLCSERDRRTEVVWGVRDFERRFGRAPEGLWLPETAVDVATLETLAAAGLRFTVLAPHQAQRIRPIGGGPWTDVDAGRLDTKVPYRVSLPSGRSLTLYFYDGVTSQAVAFERLLDDGAGFVNRLRGRFEVPGASAPPKDAIVHIATDGETYGHHHRLGEMALAFAIDALERDRTVRLTNYGELLDRFPPPFEVEIREDTSWSCAHGIERWRSDCGCRIGHEADYNQAWRAGVREAFDWLRDDLDELCREKGAALFHDPVAARDAYVDVVFERTPESIATFLNAHARAPLEGPKRTSALRLLEIQRHLLMMYTSCGWFFDELSGVEPRQNLRCAAMAVELAESELGVDSERELRTRLTAAKSNTDEYDSGGDVYDRVCLQSIVRSSDIAVHAACCRILGAAIDGPRALGSRAHAVTCLSEHSEVIGNGAGGAPMWMWAGHFRVRSLLIDAETEVGVVALAASTGLPELRAARDVDAGAHAALVERLRAILTEGGAATELTACFGGAGFVRARLHRARMQRLINVARRQAGHSVDDDGPQAWLRVAALRSLESGLDPIERALLAVVVQQELETLFENGGDPTHPNTAELTTLVRTHRLELDRIALDRSLRAGLGVHLASLAAARSGSAPLAAAAVEHLIHIVELASALEMHSDFWRVERLCFDLAAGRRDDGPDASSNAAGALARLAGRLSLDLSAAARGPGAEAPASVKQLPVPAKERGR